MSRTLVPPWPQHLPAAATFRPGRVASKGPMPLTPDSFCAPLEAFPSLEALQLRAGQLGFALSEGCLLGPGDGGEGEVWDFACEENDFSGCEWNMTVERRSAGDQDGEEDESWIVRDVEGEHNHSPQPDGSLQEGPLPPPQALDPAHVLDPVPVRLPPWTGEGRQGACYFSSQPGQPTWQVHPQPPPQRPPRSSMSVPVAPSGSHPGPQAVAPDGVRIKREASDDSHDAAPWGSGVDERKPTAPALQLVLPPLCPYPPPAPPLPPTPWSPPAFTSTIRNAKNLPGVICLEAAPPPAPPRIYLLDDASASMRALSPEAARGHDPENILAFPPECPNVWMERVITPAEDWRIFLKGMALYVGNCNGTHHYQYFKTVFVRQRGEPQVEGLLPQDPWRRPAEILQHMSRCELHGREYLTKLCKRLLSWKEAVSGTGGSGAYHHMGSRPGQGKLRTSWAHHHRQHPDPVPRAKRERSEDERDELADADRGERERKRPTRIDTGADGEAAAISPISAPHDAASTRTLSPALDHVSHASLPSPLLLPHAANGGPPPPISLPTWLSLLSPSYLAYSGPLARLGISFDDCLPSFHRLPLLEDKLAQVLEARAGLPVLHALDVSREMVKWGRRFAAQGQGVPLPPPGPPTT